MTSIRERLAEKTRRRVVVPIQLSDDTEDRETARGIEVAVGLARQRDEGQVVEQLQAELADVDARVRARYLEVELQSLTPAEWDAAEQQWSTDGEWNWTEGLAPLLAESCTHPDLRDVEFWRETLARPEWTEGDRSALRTGLLHVNVYRADPFVPKG